MSASALAAADQSSSGYLADTWLDVRLETMTKVWQGIGGHSNFFISEHDARDARGSYSGTKAYQFAETLWRFAQVHPNPTHGFRKGIREFVVDMPVEAACAVCLSNIKLGTGSVFQYYIPDWEKSLFPTGRHFEFAYKSFPSL